VPAFNLHGVLHHRYPGLAWHSLRGAFLADGGRFDMSWWRAVTRQLKGPIAADSWEIPVAARTASRRQKFARSKPVAGRRR